MPADSATGDRPLRVLAVMASLMGGGAERQMVLLLRNLDRQRFSPKLCLLARHGEFLPEVPADVPILGLGKRSPADVPLLVARLARLLRREWPDVVVSKVDYTNTIVAMAAALARCPTPLVLGEESVPSAALRNMSHPTLRRETLAWAYRRAQAVVVPSSGVAKDVGSTLGVPASRLVVIPNMIEIETLELASSRQAVHPFGSSRLPLVTAVGRLQAAKGQRDLLDAMEIVNRRRPCNLLLLGDGPDRVHLERRVSELGLSDRVALLGFVTDAPAIMSQADVFVSPSHFESFGNVIIEAMACGVPVVSTRVPAGPEWLIDDGRTGLFARAHDPEDLARCIEGVLTEQTRSAAMAAAARIAARAFSASAVAPIYEALLACVSAAGRASLSRR